MVIIGDKKLDFEVFPNGEKRLNFQKFNLPIERDFNIFWKYENDESILELVYAIRGLKEFYYLKDNQITLNILSMPYARMDRTDDVYAFTLKYVSDIINSLGMDNIQICDPHSDVCVALVNNAKSTFVLSEQLLAYRITELLEKEVRPEEIVLFYPDATAQKRYSKLTKDVVNFVIYNELSRLELTPEDIDFSLMGTGVGFKNRNPLTGEITDYQVLGDVKDKHVIIVDDLCSYGGTFIAAGKHLRELGAKSIYLNVAHCENSVLHGDLLKKDSPIDDVLTTNTIIDTNKVHKIKDDVYTGVLKIADAVGILTENKVICEFIEEVI